MAPGWAPVDPFLRAPLERFHEECQKGQIPILNHCTPAGGVLRAETFRLRYFPEAISPIFFRNGQVLLFAMREGRQTNWKSCRFPLGIGRK